MKQKRKVLMIPRWYPTNENKLSGSYHQAQAEALLPFAGVAVLYVTEEALSRPFSYLFGRKSTVSGDNGICVFHHKVLNLKKISTALRVYAYKRAVFKEYKRYAKQEGKPDIIHAQFTFPTGYAAVKLGQKYGIPVLVQEHASYTRDLFAGSSRKYARVAAGSADCYLAVSAFLAKELKEASGREQCDVLPNGVNVERFASQLRKPAGGRFDLINISNHYAVKRIDTILEALSILVHERGVKDVFLTLVGQGYDTGRYKGIMKRLGLEDYVDFAGYLPPDEVACALAKSDVLIIASEKETFCIPGIEAIAAGVPVISTRCRGPEDFMNGQTGIFVDVGDARQMADAVLAVRQNRDQYDPETMREMIARQFDEKIIIQKLLQYYEMTIKSGKRK